MNIEEVCNICNDLPAVEPTFPFDKTTLVYKVCNKMFALVDLESGDSINLKCEPEYAIELREKYMAIIPGYHMSKKHWNTIYFEQIPNSLLEQLILDSYNLVVKGLPKKLQIELKKIK